MNMRMREYKLILMKSIDVPPRTDNLHMYPQNKIVTPKERCGDERTSNGTNFANCSLII